MRQQILEVLISSSVLILALALLRILLRGKISPRLQFGLWLLVAVRLLVPVSLGQSPASVMNYVPERQMSEILGGPHFQKLVPVERGPLHRHGKPLAGEIALHQRERLKVDDGIIFSVQDMDMRRIVLFAKQVHFDRKAIEPSDKQDITIP